MHVSDTHLGKRQYNLEVRENDTYDIFHQIIEIAIKEHVNAIIHTGDFFDVSNPSNKAEIEAVRGLRELKEHKIKFIAIPGDHDSPKRSREIYPLLLLKEIELIELLTDPLNPYKIFAEGQEIKFYGVKHIPTAFSDIIRQKLRAIKVEGKRNILMLHQGYKEVLPYEGAWQLSLGELPRGFIYYALGHIHTRYEMRLDDGSIIAIAGSPDIFREEEIEGYKKFGKGVYIIDISKDQPILFKINLDIRKQDLEKINTKDIDKQINSIKNKYKNEKKKPIIHIILEGEAINKSLLDQKLRQLSEFVEHYRIYKDFTVYKENNVNIDIYNNITIDQLILNYLKQVEKFDEKDSKLILELIKTTNDQEIREILLKIGELNAN
jgi:DNA repair exonuclease SbcCD nuclease subunit